MNKEILFIGADGFVGSKAVELIRANNVPVITPDQDELDILNKKQVESIIEQTSASAIILAAAYTDVDGAQTNSGLAYQVNVIGAENVARTALNNNKFLVYISTDFVFPGTDNNPGPYSEDAPTAEPDSAEIGVYAQTKILAERKLTEIGIHHAIVRIASPFGNPQSSKDLVRKMLVTINKGYGLFTDQSYTPTYIPDFANALVKICENEMEGVFHICCQPPTTPFEFGKFITRQQNLRVEVKPGLFIDYMKNNPKLAPRPKIGGLKDDITNQRLSRSSPDWKKVVV